MMMKRLTLQKQIGHCRWLATSAGICLRQGGKVAGIYLLMLSLALPMTVALPTQAYGQNLSKGMILYQKGRIPQAEQALLQALKTTTGAEKARVLRLLGITQHMQGNQAAATRSFQMALAINPNTTISRDEVLDETVVPFFERVRATAQSSPARAPATGESLKPARMRVGKRTKYTILVVQSNAKATVLIDGIIAGHTGSKLEVSPGKVEITLRANGFKPRKQRVMIKAKRENYLNLPLNPRQPKVAPVASAAVAAKAAVAEEDDLFAEPVRRPPPPAVSKPEPKPSAKGLYAAPPAYPPVGERNRYQDSSRRPKRSAKTVSSERTVGSPIVAVLPFGIGQFQNNDFLSGSLFAGAEAFSLYIYVRSRSEISQSSTIKATLEQQEITDGKNTDRQSLIAEHEAYIAEQQTQSTLALSAFIGLAVIGAVEALWNMPTVTTTRNVNPKPTRRRPPRPKYSVLGLPAQQAFADNRKLLLEHAGAVILPRPQDATWHSAPQVFPEGQLGWSIGVDF